MPLTVPSLDDRSYREILRDALARIPVHNPEWTNFNDSDPGVTLLQVFAFMAESLLYRANQIPERNRKKFLKLLGIPLRPAQAAQGMVVIRNQRGPLAPLPLSADLDVRAGNVRFRTTTGLAVLPVEARVFIKRLLPVPVTEAEQETLDLYRLLYADLLGEGGQPVAPAFYEPAPFPSPAGDGVLPVVDLIAETVDGCVWIALLARPGDDPGAARAALAGQILTIGVMPDLTETGRTLPAGGDPQAETPPTRAVWEIARPDPAKDDGNYVPLPATPTADILRAPGLVELQLPGQIETWGPLPPGVEGTKDYPPALADSNLSERVLTWLRLRVPREQQGGSARARLSWLDINAATVVQRVQVVGELVGTGTGEPDQVVTLANRPVIPDTLTLTVGGEPYEPVDDLLAAPPEVPVGDPRRPLFHQEPLVNGAPSPRVYLLDPEAGEIRFGDGAHGARPPQGQPIVASYAYGGGRAGNVAAGAINRSPQLPAGFTVANPLHTWGGDDAEEVATAERTIPRTIQHRDRLVSEQDFRDIVLRTPGVDLGRVEVLPLYDPVRDLTNQPGMVTVMVIPARDPLAPDAPQPDFFFLDAVCRHLQPRRLITTELHLRGPRYRDIWVSVGVQVVGGRAAGPVLAAVRQALRTFLSPLHGGRDGTGWPLETPVLQRELEAVAARVDGVRLVEQLLLGTTSPTGAQSDDLTQVAMGPLELPRVAAVEATIGAAVPLAQLRSAPSAPPPGSAFAPIPVIPERC